MVVEPWLPHRRPFPVLSDEGDTVLVVPGKRLRDAVRLNPTAMALWELCDGNTAIDEMVLAVCALFDIEPGRARADVMAALEDLRAAGLIS